MKILVVGQSRSGSTLLCNIIKTIYKINKINLDFTFDTSDFKSDYEIKKIHKYNDYLHKKCDFIFSCRRDLRDSIVSGYKTLLKPWNSAFGKEWTYFDVGNDLLREYEDWEGKEDYEFIYEDYFQDKHKILNQIAASLEINADPEKILDIIQKDKPVDINDDTKIHLKARKGLSSNGGKIGVYETFFSKEEIDKINKRYESFLKRKGYLW